MLEIVSCARPEDKRDLFAAFDPTGAAWVVSDLQSKWHLQRELLARQGVLESSCVLRATELWRQFAFQLRPELRLLSPELAQTLFWNWIEPLNLPWAKSPRAVPVVLNQMQMWMSALSDPRHSEILTEWFQDNGEAYVRWGHWFELCSELWQRCQNENLVMVNWLPAVLLSEDLSRLQWTRSLTFDLGAQISQVEGQLIAALARQMDVRLIFPEAPWVSLMKNTLRPYDDLLGQPYRGDPKWQPTVNQCLEFGRYSTQLAEVKDAIARVRGWLAAGIPAEQIAIVAPDIEEYWPSLQLYAAQEGLPVAKSLTARLGGFLELARWIASLRTAMAQISSADLEVSLFAGADIPRLSCAEFRVLFTHVYDVSDLGRAEQVFREAPGALTAQEPLPMSEFLAWALKFWDARAEVQRLTTLLQAIGQEVPPGLELAPSQWLSYCEGLLARREVIIERADDKGIWCVSVSSADWLPATHAVFLNVSESALRRVEVSPVSAGEAQKVFTDTGYAVGTNDHQELEFELLWFLGRKWQALHLGFAGTDFEGRVLTPSKLWMWAAFTNGKFKEHPGSPAATRWDELQRQPLAELAHVREWSGARLTAMQFAQARELSTAYNSWQPSSGERVSASALEKYWRCPFIFAAERKLKLSDDPALDLDLDRRTRGSLLHALAERLAAEPLRFEWSDDDLAALVDEIRAAANIRSGEERLWPVQRAQHVRLARYFLQFEQAWRTRFPETYTIGRELAFQTHWSLETAEPVEAATGIVLSGRIDRVDRDRQGRYALIDYKASAGGLRNWKSWLENHEIQLALYTLLLEKGLAGLERGPVVAANYYVIKESDRRKGFHLRDESSSLYSSTDRHYNFITDIEKDELLRALKERVNSAIKAIISGNLNPAPENEATCVACAWRTLCRAPHLG